MCKSWCEAIIAAIVIVFALWDSWVYSKWVVVIAGVVLLIHSFTCKKCFGAGGTCKNCGYDMKTGMKGNSKSTVKKTTKKK